MFTIDSFVLHVTDINASKDFYAQTFQCEPKVLSPTFVALDFASNVSITLKQSSALTLSSDVTDGGTELSIPVADKSTFDARFEEWRAQGVEFAQQPEESVFGWNFVTLDPDGHRVRVFTHQ
ncbi:glyoxalase [Vibrio hyugaensis]|uniref:Glyoxalase n=1 Tax=Vibrio hyugaensis TaxID=1534743 RepID=A0ABQ5Y388_9VIBR|nr:VOC family protein [Vibrio hyugaensis]GLR04082.1 glyoxalase [Vibrio hyugaensis]